MNSPSKTYTREFKQEAVRLLLTGNKSAARLGRELGVSGVSLCAWKREALRNGDFPEHARANGLHIHYSVLEQENLRLKKELESVRREREILKKSLGILSQDPPQKGMP
jgi:transposase-like protein